MNEFLEKFRDDPITFLQNSNEKILSKIINYLNKKYYVDGIKIVSDEEYDFIKSYLQKINPKNKLLNSIGYSITNNKIKLPFFMGSMNKIKNDEETILNKWLKNNALSNGNVLCLDKLDGESAMFYITKKERKLYSRGDGYYGKDISHIIKYINITKNELNVNEDFFIRGELIINRNDFEKYKEKYKNSRNMVVGIINSKTINIELLKIVNFVPYEIYHPKINILNQLTFFEKNNFIKIHFEIVKNPTIDILTKKLIDRKKNSDYHIDGIIIRTLKNIDIDEDKNPDYAFAYKDKDLQSKTIAKVVDVEWSVSKNGRLNPIIHIEPSLLDGILIKKMTGINAKFIKENCINKNTIIEIIRSGDVIPNINKIIKKSKSPLFPNLNFTWNSTNTDIFLYDKESDDLNIKIMLFFVKTLNIEYINKGIIEKLYSNNIKNVNDLLNVSKEKLSTINGFKEKMVNKIYNNIKNCLENKNIVDFMIGTTIFGIGIGKQKMKLIFDNHPNFFELYNKLKKTECLELLTNINGIGDKTANQIYNKFHEFNNFVLNLKNEEIKKKIFDMINKKKNIENTKIIVFSGFRNKEWENILQNNGYKISDNINKNVNILIVKNIDSDSNKIKKAKKLNIEIFDMKTFEKNTINILKKKK